MYCLFVRPSLILLGHGLTNCDATFLHESIVYTVHTIFITTTSIYMYTQVWSKFCNGCVLWLCTFLLQATHRGDVLFALGMVQHIAGPLADSTSQPGRREKLPMPLILSSNHLQTPQYSETSIIQTIRLRPCIYVYVNTWTKLSGHFCLVLASLDNWDCTVQCSN